MRITSTDSMELFVEIIQNDVLFKGFWIRETGKLRQFGRKETYEAKTRLDVYKLGIKLGKL